MEGIETTQAVVAMDISEDPEPSTEPTKPADRANTREPSASASPASDPRASSPMMEADDSQNTSDKVIEVKKTKPTLHVRENLGYWKCSQTFQDGSTCGCYNVMAFKQCKDCKSRRGVGDDGTDAYGTKIAKIVHVNNENGNEFWQYLIEE